MAYTKEYQNIESDAVLIYKGIRKVILLKRYKEIQWYFYPLHRQRPQSCGPYAHSKNINTYVSSSVQTSLLINYTTKMARNYVSNDIDLMQPTQYPMSKNQGLKKLPLVFEILPTFTSLPIYNKNEYSKPNLLDYIDNKDPQLLFKLFQIDKLIDKLVEYINKNIELHLPLEDMQFPYRWKLILRQELYIYLAVLIYIGLYIESSIKDYQYKDFSYSMIYIVSNYIRANQWQQINRYFYCTQLRSKDDEAFQSTFKRIKELSKELYLTLVKFYKPSIYLTVNKTIKRFTGYVSKIINILTKPTPKGLKIWLLGNQGYVLNQIFYTKGNNKGLVDLDKYQVEEEGFLKTQVVALDLLTQEDPTTSQRLYQLNKHTVQLDNLFTSIKLLQQLQKLSISSVGTI